MGCISSFYIVIPCGVRDSNTATIIYHHHPLLLVSSPSHYPVIVASFPPPIALSLVRVHTPFRAPFNALSVHTFSHGFSVLFLATLARHHYHDDCYCDCEDPKPKPASHLPPSQPPHVWGGGEGGGVPGSIAHPPCIHSRRLRFHPKHHAFLFVVVIHSCRLFRQLSRHRHCSPSPRHRATTRRAPVCPSHPRFIHGHPITPL